MKRTFFQYCIDNYMLIVAFVFQIGLTVAAAFQDSVFGVLFFVVTFLFTFVCAIINWKKRG